MQLLSPGIGLIIWTCFILLSVLLPVIAFIHLVTFNVKSKFTWTLIILLMPIVGSLIYLTLGKKIVKREGLRNLQRTEQFLNSY